MEDLDFIKRKNNMFGSIMKHPKLSKIFSDAVAAPIGSTKRDQAKSVLSIMKKMATRTDGQGGPSAGTLTLGPGMMSGLSPMGGSPALPTTPPPSPTPNYSNMLIFPAAPAFKAPAATSTPSTTPATTKPTATSIAANSFDSPYLTPQNSAPTSGKLPLEPGLLPKLAVGIPKAVGAWKDILNADILGAGQFVGQNTAALLSRAAIGTGEMAKELFVHDPNPQPDNAVPFVSFGDTYGGNKASDLFVPWLPKNLPTSVNAATGKTPVATPTNTGVTQGPATSPTGSAQTTGGSQTGTQTQTQTSSTGTYGSAASNISTKLGIDPNTPLADCITKVGIDPLCTAYIQNEGGSPAGVINNPGNIKFNNLPGQTDSGVKATDGGTFASYATPEAGKQAIASIITAAASGKSSAYGANPTLGSFTDTYTNTGTTSGSTPSTDSSNDYGASAAVASGLGATNYAMNFADSKFGGSLDQYMANLDTKLKAQFNLQPLEQQLSDLKAEKGNLIPTLQTYMQGKDQYSKQIDDLITKHQASLMSLNMGDPNVAKQYNDYETYLYTLKGRQNQRYSNFLNSAIADYNSDVDKLTSNYNDVKQQYTDAMTQQGTMAQNDYNNLVTRMSSVYTELQNAPTNQANLEALQLQNATNAMSLAGNGINGGSTNPKYLADLASYTKQFTVPDKNDPSITPLDMTQIGPNGLISLYAQIAHAGGDQVAMTQMIGTALASTLKSSGNDPQVVTKVKKMIDDLRSQSNVPGTSDDDKTVINTWADTISNFIAPSTKSAYSSAILPKLPQIKNAVQDLVVPYGGGLLGLGNKTTGLKDQAAWMKKYSAQGLSTDLLNSIYNMVSNAIQMTPNYAKNPMSYVQTLFSGATDQENADNVATGLAVTPSS